MVISEVRLVQRPPRIRLVDGLQLLKVACILPRRIASATFLARRLTWPLPLRIDQLAAPTATEAAAEIVDVADFSAVVVNQAIGDRVVLLSLPPTLDQLLSPIVCCLLSGCWLVCADLGWFQLLCTSRKEARRVGGRLTRIKHVLHLVRVCRESTSQ